MDQMQHPPSACRRPIWAAVLIGPGEGVDSGRWAKCRRLMWLSCWGHFAASRPACMGHYVGPDDERLELETGQMRQLEAGTDSPSSWRPARIGLAIDQWQQRGLFHWPDPQPHPTSLGASNLSPPSLAGKRTGHLTHSAEESANWSGLRQSGMEYYTKHISLARPQR